MNELKKKVTSSLDEVHSLLSLSAEFLIEYSFS